MKTTLKARHLELTPALRTQIERKMHRLDRVVAEGAAASLELLGSASHASGEANVAEVTLVANGTVVRSTAPGATPLAAIDAVIDKVERQVVRSKKRPRRVRDRAADEVDAVLARAAVGEVPPEPVGGSAGRARSVVKTKRFDLTPMFEEDAIAQMEELGHAFFIFLNAETNRIGVVYRRRDGGYGVIDPVVERPGARR